MSVRSGIAAEGAKPLTADVINAADRREETPGLPGKLPDGEKLLWQGSPCWRLLALHVFHVRGLAVYFAVIVTWCAIQSLRAATPLAETALTTAELVGVSCVPLVLIIAYCWLTTKATVYTITTRRVVMKMGVVVPMTVNIPFRWIESAGMKLRADGTGDVVLALAPRDRLAYLLLWPHARPWRMARAEPMLRGLRDARGAGQVMARALATHAAAEVASSPISDETAGANAAVAA